MAFSFLSFTLLFAHCMSLVYAFPQPIRRADIERRATPLNVGQLSGLTPLSQFARAAYCPPSRLRNWSCGQACNALPGFQPTLVGGDGNAVQIFFVGFWPSGNTVVVGHQGTDPTQLMSVLTDLNINKEPLNPALFPGVPAGVEVHDGFKDQHEITAAQILAEVKRLMALHGTTIVTTVGHSLGGALAQLDSLFFTLQLPPGTLVKSVTFGVPRVGNAAYAAFFDSRVPNFQRVNNQDDLVPIIPGRSLGFAHPKGEVHLLAAGQAVACAGNDDANDNQCQIKSVPNIFFGNVIDHLGPYEGGVFIGSIFCN